MKVWETSISGRGNCKRKGPEAGMWLGNKKKATVAGVQWLGVGKWRPDRTGLSKPY